MHQINLGTSLSPQQEGAVPDTGPAAVPATLLDSLRAIVRDRPGTLGAAGLGSYIATGATQGTTTWAVVIISTGLLAAETIQNVRVKRVREDRAS